MKTMNYSSKKININHKILYVISKALWTTRSLFYELNDQKTTSEECLSITDFSI